MSNDNLVKVPELNENFLMASTQQKQIKYNIKWFQDRVEPDCDVVFKIFYNGKYEEMILQGTGFANPNLLFFHGIINGIKTSITQHISQTNYVLCAPKNTSGNIKRIPEEILRL